MVVNYLMKINQIPIKEFWARNFFQTWNGILRRPCKNFRSNFHPPPPITKNKPGIYLDRNFSAAPGLKWEKIQILQRSFEYLAKAAPSLKSLSGFLIEDDIKEDHLVLRKVITHEEGKVKKVIFSYKDNFSKFIDQNF